MSSAASSCTTFVQPILLSTSRPCFPVTSCPTRTTFLSSFPAVVSIPTRPLSTCMTVSTTSAAASSVARIYTSSEAQSTILKRGLIQDSTVPPHVQSRIDAMFDNQPTTPLQCVQHILKSVSLDGDSAVEAWTSRIDGTDVSGGRLEIGPCEIAASLNRVDPMVISALRGARDRILAFHRAQPVSSWFTSELGGVLGQAIRPIDSVGFYVPGGTAPLPSTVLMSVVPAIVAGCSQLIVVSPPLKDSPSGIADVTLAAVAILNELPQLSGTRAVRVFTVGGAQAVGALAYGTATIPRVNKIVGPGNIFVSLAKREVFGVCGIDGIYGPTEAVVIADSEANPTLVAADLLAQAEHDFLAIPILLTDCASLADAVQTQVAAQIETLDRKVVAEHSMREQGGIVVCNSMDECVDLANEFATEHVSLAVTDPWEVLPRITCAGGVFMGEGSCEVLGDYVAGPSHVMPTGGSAKFSSPLSVLDFIKIVSVVGLDKATVRAIAPEAEAIARSEGLDGHANAAAMRKGFGLDEEGKH